MTTPWKRLNFIFLIVFLLPAVSFAGGQKEDPVETAEALIDERKWDDAILIIKEMMENDRRRFDDGQKVIQEIMYNKRIYNEYFQKLVDAYLAGDLELAYKIIGEMEAQDPNPNPRTKALIVEARATAGVIATKNRFENIMAEAQTAIDEKRFYDAISIYLTGSDIARDLFGDLELGNIVEDRVDNENVRIQELARRVIGLRDEIDAQISAVNGLSRPVTSSRESMDGFRETIVSVNRTMDEVLGLYRGIVEDSIDILAYHDFLQEANNLEKDIYHLKYIAYLYSGRPSAQSFEGISGVVDILTGSIVDPMESFSHSMNVDTYTHFHGVFRSDDFEQASGILRSLDEILDFYFLAQEGWPLRTVIDNRSGELWRNNLRDYEEAVKHTAYAETLKSLIGVYETADRIGSDFLSVTRGSESLTDPAEYENRRERLGELMAELEDLVPGDDIPVLDPLIESSESTQIVSNYFDDRETLLNRMIAADIRLVENRIRVAVEDYSKALQESRKTIDSGIQAMNGYQQEEDEGGLYLRDPAGAKADFIETREKDNKIKTDIDSLVLQYEDNPEYVTKNEAVLREIQNLRDLQDTVDTWDAETEGHIETADTYLFQAQRFRQEGDDYLQEARSLLARNEFERARQRVEDAVSRYDESLSFQEDEEIRSKRDEDIPALYDEIINEQKQAVVKEVRTLINQGREFYSQGSFIDAESVLLRAQARNSDVSNDPDLEIEYWLQLAQTALSVNSGREILPVDPLYPEMTQLLNLAKADYNEAKKAYAAGNETRGVELLNQAETRILTVQQPFPINQEAGLLALKILQLRDPDEFDQIFRDRFNEALAKVRRGGQDADEGYIELKDLQALRPDFRGMDSAIYEAEIATGIRIPPPDKTKLVKATKFYEEAYAIVQRNATSQFPIALNAVNEALKLNPDYLEAIRLKDRIQSSGVIAGKTVIFSPEDQRLYEEAVSAYQRGLYREAQLIVDRLLQKKDNQRNSKLLELKERIQSRL